jgi:SAM-dependent methyltransferase
MTTIQVDASHYQFERYVDIKRWSSYWHQLREVLALQPKSVLEVGVGTGINSLLLRQLGCETATLDIDPALKPTHVGSVTAIPLADASYDVVAAFQVLEHLPYERFEACLAGLARRAAPWCLISLPYFGLHFRLSLSFAGLRLSRGFSIPAPVRWKFNGEHYWELGWEHSPRAVTRTMAKYFEVVSRGFVPENPYHYLWVLRSRAQ